MLNTNHSMFFKMSVTLVNHHNIYLIWVTNITIVFLSVIELSSNLFQKANMFHMKAKLES